MNDRPVRPGRLRGRTGNEQNDPVAPGSADVAFGAAILPPGAMAGTTAQLVAAVRVALPLAAGRGRRCPPPCSSPLRPWSLQSHR